MMRYLYDKAQNRKILIGAVKPEQSLTEIELISTWSVSALMPNQSVSSIDLSVDSWSNQHEKQKQNKTVEKN